MSYLLTEIALEMLGYKFHDIDGVCKQINFRKSETADDIIAEDKLEHYLGIDLQADSDSITSKNDSNQQPNEIKTATGVDSPTLDEHDSVKQKTVTVSDVKSGKSKPSASDRNSPSLQTQLASKSETDTNEAELRKLPNEQETEGNAKVASKPVSKIRVAAFASTQPKQRATQKQKLKKPALPYPVLCYQEIVKIHQELMAKEDPTNLNSEMSTVATCPTQSNELKRTSLLQNNMKDIKELRHIVDQALKKVDCNEYESSLKNYMLDKFHMD